WTGGRTGWMPAADLEPHASFVLIDAASGHVLRRMAAKGQWGVMPDGRAFWSLSDTGLTRILPGDSPAFWSNPVQKGRDGMLPAQSVWAPDRSRFYLRQEGEGNATPLIAAVPATGVVRALAKAP